MFPSSVAQAASARPSRAARLALGGLVLGLAQSVASPLEAQSVDPRWQPWLGCWAPLVGAIDDPTLARSSSQVVCITPATSGSGVDIATVSSGKREAPERLEATGARVAKTRDGCNGWEEATFSPDARRLTLRSEFVCAGGATRKSSGIFAFTKTGEFLQVHGVNVGGNVAVRAARFVESESLIADSVRAVAPASSITGFSAGTARLAATSDVTADDVAEVANRVDPQVTEAWLLQLGQGFRLDARQLVRMADAGVQPRVIDLMVALSNPKTFAIQRAGEIDRAAQVSQGDGGGRFGNAAYMPIGYGAWQMGAWGLSPFDYGYGMGMYGNRFGAFGFNNIWGSPFIGNGLWGNQFFGNNPIVIVNRGEPSGPPGRAINGAGYTRGGDRTGSPAGRSDSFGPMRGSSPTGGSSGGATGGASSGGGGNAGGGGRTAKPRGSGL